MLVFSHPVFPFTPQAVTSKEPPSDTASHRHRPHRTDSLMTHCSQRENPTTAGQETIPPQPMEYRKKRKSKTPQRSLRTCQTQNAQSSANDQGKDE